VPPAIFIDTSYVLALIDRRDENHARAIQLVRKYDNASIIITDAVLLEIGAALARGFRQQAVQIIEQFQTSPNVEILYTSANSFEEAFQMFKKYQDKDWSLTDCLSFVVMRQHGIDQALSFDYHFQQAGFVALMRDV
jgi:predicted nucleic acid-binding protein